MAEIWFPKPVFWQHASRGSHQGRTANHRVQTPKIHKFEFIGIGPNPTSFDLILGHI